MITTDAKTTDATMNERMAAHRRESQERSGFDFDEFIAAGTAVIIGGALLIGVACAIIIKWLDDHPDE